MLEEIPRTACCLPAINTIIKFDLAGCRTEALQITVHLPEEMKDYAAD